MDTKASKEQNATETITEREREILVLMAQGKSGKEIAAHLSISPQTVQSHTKRIYRKLNVHNKIEALNKITPYWRTTDSLPQDRRPELTA